MSEQVADYTEPQLNITTVPRDGKEGAGGGEAHGETTFWGPPAGAPHLVRGERRPCQGPMRSSSCGLCRAARA